MGHESQLSHCLGLVGSFVMKCYESVNISKYQYSTLFRYESLSWFINKDKKMVW